MKAATILETIGNTPHVRMNRLFPTTHEVWLKLERANPGGSIKDRIALAMIEDAEKRGLLKPGPSHPSLARGNQKHYLSSIPTMQVWALMIGKKDEREILRRFSLRAIPLSINPGNNCAE